jgi:small-conductance mechanosensitive channel
MVVGVTSAPVRADLPDGVLVPLVLVLALLASLLLVMLLRRLALRWGVAVLSGHLWQSPVVLLVVLATARGLVSGTDEWWTGAAVNLLGIGVIVSTAWLLVVVVHTLHKAALAKHPQTGLGDERSRHARTKIDLLERVANAAIVTVAVGAILWMIPQVQAIGATVLASAGLVSIVAGLAAQTTLANIFAGVQIAFTDGIRVGDIVVVEGAQGRIEEITLTYIVVEVWDGTRLILPCTYFTTTPFENRSHAGASVIGQVQLRVDWTIPVEQVRTELARVLAASPRWDRRHSQLSVEDASGDAVQLIAQFSATADEIELLRFDVREALVRFVRDHHPSSLPRYRQQVVTVDGRQPAATAGVGGSS